MLNNLSSEYPQKPRRADIQQLRGIAVIAVIAFHAGLDLPGGFLGVDTFFVISGFVISQMVFSKLTVANFDLKDFLLNRLFRLAPTLIVVVLATVAFSDFFYSPKSVFMNTLTFGISAILGLSNVLAFTRASDYFSPDLSVSQLLHTWSLSVEEQFYFFFAIGLWFTFSKPRRLKFLLVFSVFTIALLALFATQKPDHWKIAFQFLGSYYSPVWRTAEFAVGIWTFFASGKVQMSAKSSLVARRLGLVILIAAYLLGKDTDQNLYWSIAFAVLGTALIIISKGIKKNISPFLHGLLKWVGDRSYSLYLWHLPILAAAGLFNKPWIATPVALVLTATLSQFTHKVFEIKIRGVLVKSPAKPILKVAAILASAATALGAVSLAHFYLILPSFVSKTSTSADWFANKSGCFTAENWTGQQISKCTFAANSNISATSPQIALVGDSNAAHWGDGLRQLARGRDYTFFIGTSPYCMFMVEGKWRWVGPSPYTKTAPLPLESCSNRNKRIALYLSKHPQSTVVLASADIYFWDRAFVLDFRGHVLRRQESKLKAYRIILSDTLKSLTSQGHSVAVIQTVPQYFNPYPGWTETSCGIARKLINSCSAQAELVKEREIQGGVRSIVSSFKGKPSIQIYDPWTILCDSKICHTSLNGDLLYSDAMHLNVIGSKTIFSHFNIIAPPRGNFSPEN